jgi:hypothetical protein
MYLMTQSIPAFNLIETEMSHNCMTLSPHDVLAETIGSRWFVRLKSRLQPESNKRVIQPPRIKCISRVHIGRRFNSASILHPISSF